MTFLFYIVSLTLFSFLSCVFVLPGVCLLSGGECDENDDRLDHVWIDLLNCVQPALLLRPCVVKMRV